MLLLVLLWLVGQLTSAVVALLQARWGDALMAAFWISAGLLPLAWSRRSTRRAIELNGGRVET
ncbi:MULTISPECIES: hypothetical protein [unclassified Modestobacter]